MKLQCLAYKKCSVNDSHYHYLILDLQTGAGNSDTAP